MSSTWPAHINPRNPRLQRLLKVSVQAQLVKLLNTVDGLIHCAASAVVICQLV